MKTDEYYNEDYEVIGTSTTKKPDDSSDGEPKITQEQYSMTQEQYSGLCAVIEVVNALNVMAPKTLEKILDRMDLDTDAFFEELRNVTTLVGDDA
jgi:hypothetical protein